MEIKKEVSNKEIVDHWKAVEGFSSEIFRWDIREPIPSDIKWYLGMVEDVDLEKIFIISSDDWRDEGLCVPNFKLNTAVNNYKVSLSARGKYKDIERKEQLFNTSNLLDTKLFIVSNDITGPYTIIEGNKRAVALGRLKRLLGLEFYLGIAPGIRSYLWARYSFS